LISSIEIANFRGIRDGKLENLTPLTILVGPNGCGKSTVLDAMLVGASSAPEMALCQVAGRHEGVHDKGRWLFWAGKEPADEAKILVQANGSTRESILRATTPSISTAATIEIGYSAQSPTGREFRLSGTLRGEQSALLPVRSAMPPPLEGVKRIELVEPGTTSSGPPLVESHPGQDGAWDIMDVMTRSWPPLDELYSEATRTGYLDTAIPLFTDVVPGMKDLRILIEGGAPVLYFVYQHGALPVAIAGDGVHALVRIALQLASFRDGVALIEEAEVHQHPGAMRQTARAIVAAVRRNIQVVLTTHSLEFIDTLLAEANDEDVEKLSLYRLTLEDGRLIAVQSSGSQVAFCRSEIEEDPR
jgi:hypothetical protein